jgi:hypothetical protein
MWIYEYRRFDGSGFLPVGPYDSPQAAADAMTGYAERFGATVQGPKRVDREDLSGILSYLLGLESKHPSF